VPLKYSVQGAKDEGKIAQLAGATCNTIAFKFSSAAVSMIESSSARCCATERPGLEGQSMFATVATQAALNSANSEVLGAGGSWVWPIDIIAMTPNPIEATLFPSISPSEEV
jgi:hypothetical protein